MRNKYKGLPNCIFFVYLLFLQIYSKLLKTGQKMISTTNRYFVLDLLMRFVVLCIITVRVRSSSSHCTRSCPGATPSQVPYPFGFSESCEIKLNCIKEKIQIGEFQVNVSAKSISVYLPAKCNRPIKDLKPLFGKNYALTLQNGLLLQNCSKLPAGCVIPQAIMRRQFMFNNCSDESYCFSKDDGGTGFMKYSDVENSSCRLLFSSVAAAAANTNLALLFQTVVLGWWLDGECNCSSNANCTNITSPVNGSSRFRCECVHGFKGDGFAAGNGCWEVSSECNASKYLSGQCGGNTRIGVLIGGVIAGACIVTGLAFLCYLCRRRSISTRARESTKKLLSETAGSFNVPFYTYKEIERATFCFSEKYRLGTGAYGTVYAGKLPNEDWVAIKKIRYRDRDGIESIMNEIKLISSVNHPNLVRLLGFCLEKGEQILVYEFMPNGTLCQHLQKEIGTGLPWTIRLNIAVETAHAIAHLHSAMDPPIYHRDIKSSNILLDLKLNAKVADFGLSRIGKTEISHISTAPQGTPGYLDPQYHQNYHLSDKSDVYSFGVVLVEIITAMKAVDFSRPQSEVNLASLAIEKIGKGCIDEIIDPFLDSHKDAWTLSSIHKMTELAFRCLAFHRDARPTMMEVAAELEQIKVSGWQPLEGNMCTQLSNASWYSSPSKGNEKSPQSVPVQNEMVEKSGEAKLKDWSPVSVNGQWLSEQSSPSTNSFPHNATQ